VFGVYTYVHIPGIDAVVFDVRDWNEERQYPENQNYHPYPKYCFHEEPPVLNDEGEFGRRR